MSENPQTPSNGPRPVSESHDEKSARQCVKYSFFKVDPAFRRLSAETQIALKLELIHTVRAFNRRMLLRAYSLFGLRGDVDFMLWQVAEEVDAFNALAAAIFSTGIGTYLQMPHSFLAMTRRSIYDIGVGTDADEVDQITIQPGDAKYLFVYPFVKTRAWYALSFEERQRMMSEHIRVGRKYPSIRLNTTYSFGLDDQEFVVAFEGDNPADFLDLVMELRDTEASRYTLRDTPTFSAISMSLPETLDSIGGPQVADQAGPDVVTVDGWVQTVHLADVPPGTATRVYMGSQQIALFNVEGQLYAINNRCPHARGPLCEGVIHNEHGEPAVTCPWHKADFDLRTGTAIDGPTQAPVRTYAVRVGENGTIYVAEQEKVKVAQ
ncbi:MAG TPA: nitrite reductase small subunit NirD [Aggregatilineales bacterium]|nr:nitrite reductase small subunit NirD [Aggregatilineales bacterium]